MKNKQQIITGSIFLILAVSLIYYYYYDGMDRGKKYGIALVCKTIKPGDNVSELTKCACSPDCCLDKNAENIVPCK